ncbi:MAG: hypothetical protein DBX55_05320 [Verrucomicrobia bacterium]|nr:MAG: hypothetical protein DBX55_05320 [Verrucomicrobiota bacterium]
MNAELKGYRFPVSFFFAVADLNLPFAFFRRPYFVRTSVCRPYFSIFAVFQKAVLPSIFGWPLGDWGIEALGH